MPAHRRRGLIRTFGALAATGTLAGCVEDTLGGDDGGDDPRLRGDGVVDYPGMVDGAASVASDGRTVEYEDPAVTFELTAGYRGEEADGSQLRVGRDLSGETMGAFVAPAYLDDEERFEYHVFANEAFVAFADWYVVALPSDPVEGLGAAAFEHLAGSVHGFVVSPTDVEGIGVVDVPADAIHSDEGDDLTGVAIKRTASMNVRATAPQVSFEFNYDPGSEQLEVVHDGGESVDAAALAFRGEGDIEVVEGFRPETLTTGDSATLDVSGTSTVRVVWEHAARSHTLDYWEKPDA